MTLGQQHADPAAVLIDHQAVHMSDGPFVA
jgi:hypothetical protein